MQYFYWAVVFLCSLLSGMHAYIAYVQMLSIKEAFDFGNFSTYIQNPSSNQLPKKGNICYFLNLV